MKTKTISFIIAAILYLSLVTPVTSINVTIFVNSSASNYPAGISNSSWTVLATSPTITSIDPSKIVTSQTTNATGHAVLNLSTGTYYITALNYNSTAQHATPLYMGMIMDSYTDLHILNTSNETTGTINDYSNASAIRGYVKDKSGAGLNSGKVYFSGTYRGVDITPLSKLKPVTTRTFGGQKGYYAMFFPIENTSTIYTAKATKSGYVSSSKNVNLTRGFGSSSADLVNFTLASTPSGGGGGGGFSGLGGLEEIVFVSNSIDLGLADDFLGYLMANNIAATVISAEEFTFEVWDNNRIIIILGGPDAPEGIGGIVGDILSDSEAAAVRSGGTQSMFVKYNVYTDKFTYKQKVIILAGSDRSTTQAAGTKYRSDVKTKIFD